MAKHKKEELFSNGLECRMREGRKDTANFFLKTEKNLEFRLAYFNHFY